MNSWDGLFKVLKQKDYFLNLEKFLDKEYSTKTIYPERQNIFRAFDLCEKENLKCVIIGQDPYHEVGQATGLAFSVPSGFPLPPSLRNIYREIESEFNAIMPEDGDLSYLAEQGVLLINAYLTVIEGNPLSHKLKEYDALLRDIFEYLDAFDEPICFLLWGGFAKKYAKYVKNPKHIIFESGHPSPLSANQGCWFGNDHFKKANEYLLANGKDSIEWVKPLF